MDSEDLVVLLADDDLAYSLAALILCDKAAGVGHWKLDDRIFLAGSLGLLLGESDSGDLWVGIDDSRDGVVAHMIFLSKNIVDRDLALAARRVGQHREAGHVAGGIDSRNIRAHPAVHLDSARFSATVQEHLDSKVLKAESRDVGTAAHRDENLVPADPLGVALRILIDNGVALDSGDLALEAEVHATFGVDLLKHSADLIVKRSENLRKHLNHSHFRTESAIESRELHSDDTSTDDNELGRTLFQRKDLTVGDDNVSGLLQTRERRHGGL